MGAPTGAERWSGWAGARRSAQGRRWERRWNLVGPARPDGVRRGCRYGPRMPRTGWRRNGSVDAATTPGTLTGPAALARGRVRLADGDVPGSCFESSRAVGLGGRDRRAASASERARAGSPAPSARRSPGSVGTIPSSANISAGPSAPAPTAPTSPTLGPPPPGDSDIDRGHNDVASSTPRRSRVRLVRLTRDGRVAAGQQRRRSRMDGVLVVGGPVVEGAAGTNGPAGTGFPRCRRTRVGSMMKSDGVYL